MKRLLCLMTVAGALLGAGEAHAQFDNRSLRVTLGYMGLAGTDKVPVERGVPLGLGYTGYIEAGWEWTFDVQVMLLTRSTDGYQFIGAAGGPGIRYLFMQEELRPWVGADISYLHLFADFEVANLVGLGPKVGLDYFVADTVSLGLVGQSNFYFALNDRVQTSFGIHGVVAAWF
ncbi:MAG: hypothetical protein WBV82_06105 [Myxococcaceae bacterium]